MTQAVGRVMGSARAISDRTVFGYAEGTSIMAAFLRPGADIAFTRPLYRGQEYVILGGGDQDVQDLDVEISDPDGRVIARDTRDDAAPIVRFVAPRDGSYTIRQRLCEARSSSFCVVAVLRARGFDVPVSNLTNATVNLMELCSRVSQNRGGRVVFQDADNQWAIFGAVLQNGEERTITNLALGQGRRVLVAAGDNNARDIDLFVLDRNGDIAARDTAEDATPIADVTVSGNSLAGVRFQNVNSQGPALVLAAILRVAGGWGPGQFMRESMIKLLAPALQIIGATRFGFSQPAYLGACLQPGRFSFLTTTLTRGRTYAFLGAGNHTAQDLDIIIEDASGKVVAQDVDDNATPRVQFTPSRTGRYTLKLKLHDAIAPSFCGMVLLRQNGWTVPARNLDIAMDNMLAHCQNVATRRAAKFLDLPGEWAVVGTIIEPGKSSTFTDIRLGSGRRAITSGGDSVTRDIGLEVFEDGATPRLVLDTDQGEDAAPVVQCTASSFKRYGLEIKNPRFEGGTMIMTALLDVD
ncbi:MAG TPA: hypothetical protein VKA15_17120 [Isosphaeraceae bacterium]|nr:hypothetical protein [Isosphaeraceae bacterium]